MSQLMKCNKELDELFYDGHLIARTSQENSRYSQRNRIFRTMITADSKSDKSSQDQKEYIFNP